MKSIVVSAIALMIADTNDGGWRLMAPPAAQLCLTRDGRSRDPAAAFKPFQEANRRRRLHAEIAIKMRFMGTTSSMIECVSPGTR